MKKVIITLTVLLFGGLFSDMISQDKKVKDTSDFIRELVDKIKNEKEIDEARYPALIKEVETRAVTSENPEEAAILHSLLAEMYISFEQRNSWKFAQRTPLAGYVPADINEWTSNIFQEKIMEAFRLSLQQAERLQQIPIGKYAVILQTGKDEALRPTLYDYLLYRVLAFNPTDDLYQELIAYKKKADNPEALLLASLDYLKFIYSADFLRNGHSAYLAALDSLYQAYTPYDFAAEVWIERIQCLENKMGSDANQVVSVYPEIADLCKQAIDRYPSYKRIGFFKNKLSQIQNPELQVSMPSVVYPRQEIVLALSYKNLKSIHIKIYETDRKPETLDVDGWSSSRNSKKENIHRRLIRQVRSVLTVPPLYQNADTTIRISGLEENGIYECEFLAPETDLKSSQLVFVTSLMAVSRSGMKSGSDILVTNMRSGAPVDRATVLFYAYKSNERVLVDSLYTDENGLVKVPVKEIIRYYRVVKKDDTYMPFSSLSPGKSGWRIDSGETTTVALFTDRGLYRPGQSVFVKGIVYAGEKENRQVVSGKTVEVILRDANHKEMTTQTFTTNEFGSFNGEFLLPKYGLNGSFSLSAKNTTQFFRVEEYKRPSFFLEMDSLRGEIAFGDTVRLSGKAQTFSGSALQKGTVSYRVILRPFRLFYDRSGFSESQVSNGESLLDENGSFAFNFVPEKPAYTIGRTTYSSYEVIATLTDSRGETQETRSFFSVGTSSLVLSTDLSENEKKETCSVRITAQTLNGEKVAVQGRFMLYPLTEPEKRQKDGTELIPGDVVKQGDFSTESALANVVFASLPSGSYRLRLDALDAKGRTVQREQDFVLYSEKDKRPPVFSDIWLLEREFFVSPEEDVEFVFGTSHKKAHVLYELVADGKLVSRKWLELSDENRKITIPFSSSYGDGAVASFTFIKEGKLYTRQVRIYKKLPDKKLILKTETFRDRLVPGSRETWRFNVLSSDSLPAVAEILASMYDASLDAITPFDWYFSPEYRPYLVFPAFGNNPAYFSRSSFASGTVNYLNVPEFEYSHLDWQNALLAPYIYMTRRSYASTSMKESAVAVADMGMMGAVPNAMEELAVGAEEVKKESGGEETTSSLRRNFQETAFFFPVLRTDKAGNWMVNFTLPESNTTWKFQVLAHTKDMKYGQLVEKIVSNKPLMVLPYIPRFVRNGDEMDLRALIMNRSEEVLKGRVRLELFNPETEENIVCSTKAQIPFSLDAGQQTTVNWRVHIPAGYDLLGVRVLAETETVSDGEQHLLPVLPNEMLMTESRPFYLPGESEKEIAFSPVPEKTTRTYRQVLELSANPVWYAVQALSTLLLPENSSASSWFATYYSNTLASFIVRSNSRMRTIIEQWVAKSSDAASLLSRLEQNEELKNVLLEETPWVLEAETETAQIARLNVLFDLNRAVSQQMEALQELMRLQREDGAWGWFDGFTADRYITTSILQGMADLANLNAVEYGPEEKEMQMRALIYLDGKIEEDYTWLKKQSRDLKTVLPSEPQLAYLLMRSNYRDIPETQETREAIRFYTAQAEKVWEKLPVHMRVQTALLLFRNGKKEKARTIMNWFVRTATRSEEQGVFWANNRRIGFSPVSPVETHVLLMTAFVEMKMVEMDVDGMKQWLLNQKHTQYWETTPATLNAVYALLSTGIDWLAENNRVVAHWGNEVIDTQQGTTGIGYVKSVRTGKESIAYDRVRVRKEGQAPAWGALYRQYFIPVDQVKRQKGDLSVNKQFFVEKISEKGRQLVVLESGRSLRVGEKVVVRLTLHTRQEMSYVHLKDMRAACFEPVDQLSGTQFRESIAYYRTSKDASEHFYFDRLPEGVFVLEYTVYVSRAGEYTSGPADIQCLYAPEYTSHTEGGRLIIKD